MERVRIGTRERRPEPNFRDFGMMVDGPILRLVGNLQKRWGYAALSEASIRSLILQDTGHVPGVSTVPKALRRMELLGRIEVRWIRRGGRHPEGTQVHAGILRMRLAVNRADVRSIAARARKVDRREGVDAPIVRGAPIAPLFFGPRGAPQLAPSLATRERDLPASKARGAAAAAELLERWRAESGDDDPERPPMPGRPGTERAAE